MNITVNFKNMDHSDGVEDKINQKCRKLQKFLKDNADVSWTCSVEDKMHHCEVQISNHGKQFHAKASEDNMYKTLDTVIEKLENQMRHAH